MTVAIALFTRDLRVTDNPVLTAAARSADQVVPLFVVDDHIRRASPNRARFLADSLADLDSSLKGLGGRLVIRRGDPVEEVTRVAEQVGAAGVHIAADVTGYAHRREESLRGRLGSRLQVHDEVVTAIAPGRVIPAGGDHFAVFTPYFRRWAQTSIRTPLRPPRSLDLPRIAAGRLPKAQDICAGDPSPKLPRGGETEGRERLKRWLDGPFQSYSDQHDDLAGNNTSRLSPWLHFGCLSATEIVQRCPDRQNDFVRQVAWRDFHHQVLAARPDAAHADYRGHDDRWRRAEQEVAAWKSGHTGYPIVDAGMRQLLDEGWMHNRARLLVASFLTKTLYVDWRVGAAHFLSLLVDGDVANNQLNWQWVAGTGTDTRPNRVLNPLRQAERFDPDGEYVRRYVPELAGIDGPAVHQPWKLPKEVRSRLDYPDPIVDLAAGLARFRSGRG